MNFPDLLSNGSPEFMLGVAALIVGLIQSQTVADRQADGRAHDPACPSSR